MVGSVAWLMCGCNASNLPLRTRCHAPSSYPSLHSYLYQLWANVQTPGLHHKAHYHAGVTVAGTYYVAVPRRAGALHLQDPRGRLDPFSRDIIHRPSPGDLLLWPPWLIHR